MINKNWLKDAACNILIPMFTFFIIVSFVGFCFGLVDGRDDNCKYQSIISYNPGYFLSCELAKPRFKDK